MSSPDHPTSNVEDAFSSNFPNYLPPASPDYIPTSPGKTYSSSSNSFGIVPLASPTLSLFHDDPYMKALQAFYTEKSPIPPPTIIPSSIILINSIKNSRIVWKHHPTTCLDSSVEILTLPTRYCRMPPKRTSTSEAPAMTQDAIRKLVADSVTVALEAQVATMTM
ncbi:hypothetical protein Tco_0321960 [Tanacetum coccineum]